MASIHGTTCHSISMCIGPCGFVYIIVAMLASVSCDVVGIFIDTCDQYNQR